MGIKSFFSSFGHFFISIWKVFTKGEVKEVREKIKDFTEIAYPIIKMITVATPFVYDDLLLEAAKNIAPSADGIIRSVEDILTSTDMLIKNGGRQQLAVEAIKLRLIELVQKEGRVEFDHFIFNTVEDVLNVDLTTLLTVVQDTYNLIHKLELTKGK